MYGTPYHNLYKSSDLIRLSKDGKVDRKVSLVASVCWAVSALLMSLSGNATIAMLFIIIALMLLTQGLSHGRQ